MSALPEPVGEWVTETVGSRKSRVVYSVLEGTYPATSCDPPPNKTPKREGERENICWVFSS